MCGLGSGQHLFSCSSLVLDSHQRFQKLAGAAPFHRCFHTCTISTNPVYGSANQQICKFSTHAQLMTFFFCFAFVFPACCSFSSYCLSPSDTALGKRGREDSLVCFLSLSVVQGHLDWCHVKFYFRPGSKQWVRCAEREGSLICSSLISILFLASCLLRQKEVLTLKKRKYWPIFDIRIVSVFWLTPVGLLIHGQTLAPKTMDSDADGSCRNMEESGQMRMLQPKKFYKPTR